MLKGRNLTNLGNEEETLSAFETIISYFGKEYLESNSNHRLMQLWSRPDRLATIELYILGKCLQSFGRENEKWLKDTVRRIKKEQAKSHGLFTEILYFGIFSMHNSKIEPAKNNNPGYDFSITLPNGNKQIVTVKNIDISDSYKNFLANCRKLRIKWKEKLKHCGSNLGIRITSRKTLDDHDFSCLLNAIQSMKTLQVGEFHQIDSDILLHIHNLPGSEYTLSPENTSDLVLIFCPGSSSEKTRYSKKIRDAVSNIRKCTIEQNTSRVVFMRMHVNADYNYIKDTAKSFIDAPNNEVDCIICYQPSYVRDEKNQSLINHCFKIDMSPRYALRMAGSDHFRVEPPVGSVSFEQALTKIMNLNDDKEIYISPSDYFFQQGDIYQMAKADSDGSLFNDDMGSPAAGIRKHCILFMEGKYLTITPKFLPLNDELLII